MFSTNVVIGRAVAGDVGPWTLAFLRWAAAFLIVLPFSASALLASRAALLAQAPWIGLLAVLGMWICGGLVYTALQSTTAANATLIYTSSNVMILLLDRLFRGRAIRAREVAGTAMAFAGVAIVVLGQDASAGFTLNPGDLLMTVAALSWAIYSVVLKRPGLTQLPGLPLFAAIMLAGAFLLLPMALIEAHQGLALPRTAEAWAGVAAVALIPSVGAFSGYQYGVRRFGPSTMAMLSYLTTPYGVLLALAFLGEQLRLHHALAFALILPGIILATAPGMRGQGAEGPA